MKSLIIHIPKGFTNNNWNHNFINVMPMGIFSIANFANRHGHKVKIMNASIYGDHQKATKIITERIQTFGAQTIGFSLHWHLSSRDVIELINILKVKMPHLFTVIGGITASVYAKEFLSITSNLDAVIQGDGEIPFKILLDQLSKDTSYRALSLVPNLHWRDSSKTRIISNQLSYVAKKSDMDSFDFGIESIFNKDEYVNRVSFFDAIHGKNQRVLDESAKEKWFFLNIGRGCSLNCIYCSGCREAFKKFYNRDGVVVRSVDSVMKTILQIKKSGFSTIHICFDPPFRGKDTYYENLFHRIQDELPREFDLIFELYHLPSIQFLNNCSSAFRRVYLALSPGFFSLEVMREHMGYWYSHENLCRLLEKIRDDYDNTKAYVFYIVCGLENWKGKDLAEKIQIMKKLRDKYKCEVIASPVYAEPGSPWVSFQHMTPNNKINMDFNMFWKEWKKPLDHWNNQFIYNLTDVETIMRKIEEEMRPDALRDFADTPND